MSQLCLRGVGWDMGNKNNIFHLFCRYQYYSSVRGSFINFFALCSDFGNAVFESDILFCVILHRRQDITEYVLDVGRARSVMLLDEASGI